MSKLRRYYSSGNLYFVTIVTFNRRPILIDNINILNDAMNFVGKIMPFKTIAHVILPDHFHLLIDPAGHNLSETIKRIKLRFSGKYRYMHRMPSGRIWQLRFWDHIIRDERDMNRHIDYIHFNPVKHQMVHRPIDYEHSSFRKFVADGYYRSDWGSIIEPSIEGEFGE
jgi:putative transposase